MKLPWNKIIMLSVVLSVRRLLSSGALKTLVVKTSLEFFIIFFSPLFADGKRLSW